MSGDPSQPSNDPSLAVPNGRYQPVDSIGRVWRENSDVRNRLGWAYEPQSKFLGRMQSYLWRHTSRMEIRILYL